VVGFKVHVLWCVVFDWPKWTPSHHWNMTCFRVKFALWPALFMHGNPHVAASKRVIHLRLVAEITLGYIFNDHNCTTIISLEPCALNAEYQHFIVRFIKMSLLCGYHWKRGKGVKGGEAQRHVYFTDNSNTTTNLAMHQSWSGTWASLLGINPGRKDPTSFVWVEAIPSVLAC